MTVATFRRIALGMEGATEGAHMNHPDFRANGKIFASINEDHTRGTVKLTPEQQERFVREYPAMFEPAAASWGRQGYTMVHLKAAEAEAVGEAMTLAWQNLSRQVARKTSGRPKAAKTRPRT